jgi:hypothetical protein
MIYGIVSEKDGDTTTGFLNKEILLKDIFHINELDMLVSRLSEGDTVICLNVDRFLCVSRYVVFIEKVVQVGASLQCLEQPYLNVGNGRHWNSAVLKYINLLAQLEKMTIARVYNESDISNTGRYFVGRCIGEMSITILSKIHSIDRIMY